MDQKTYYGNLLPEDVATILSSQFNRGAFRVFKQGTKDQMAIQIANNQPDTGGQTALTVVIQKVEDGVSVKIGQQALFGVAASLGFSIFTAIRNPWNLLGRLDDIATDIESLQLTQQVWDTIDSFARSIGAGQELSERLRRLECDYCGSANPVGESNCVACGAPLGSLQPRTCIKCGYVFKTDERFCPNCGESILLNNSTS
ncbi:MAG TPA: zinc ribbon domain-containing protein [Leptolinea sp.]